MKKLIIFILVSAIISGAVFVGMNVLKGDGGNNALPKDGELYGENNGNSAISEMKGVWLAYYETADMCRGKTEEEYKASVEALLANLKDCGINTVFYQARAFADSLYYSKIFPVFEYISESGEKPGFDPLSVFVKCADEYGMSVHAWVNPFRVSYGSKVNALPTASPAIALYKENPSSLIVCEKGVYFNPASTESTRLIIEGIRELLENYDIDGIQFDDYFYPPCDFSGDETIYQNYIEGGGELTLEDFRRSCVSEFVSNVYTVVKAYGENKVFGISPSAKVEYNKNTLYADTELWCREDGYIDYIMPQIYYGFENDTMPFEKVAAEWRELVTNKNVALYCGLALYKAGVADENAGSGKNEWQNSSNIISRQYEVVMDLGYNGFALFSCKYFSAENSNDFSEEEIKALTDMLE